MLTGAPMGQQAFRGLVSGRGGVGIDLPVFDAGQTAALDRLAAMDGRIAQGFAEIIADEVDEALMRIVASWPRDTGFSASRWAALQLGPHAWVIRNTAVYSPFVRRKGASAPLVENELPREIARTRKLIWTRAKALSQAVLSEQEGQRVTPRRIRPSAGGFGVGSALSAFRRLFSSPTPPREG